MLDPLTFSSLIRHHLVLALWLFALLPLIECPVHRSLAGMAGVSVRKPRPGSNQGGAECIDMAAERALPVSISFSSGKEDDVGSVVSLATRGAEVVDQPVSEAEDVRSGADAKGLLSSDLGSRDLLLGMVDAAGR